MSSWFSTQFDQVLGAIRRSTRCDCLPERDARREQRSWVDRQLPGAASRGHAMQSALIVLARQPLRASTERKERARRQGGSEGGSEGVRRRGSVSGWAGAPHSNACHTRTRVLSSGLVRVNCLLWRRLPFMGVCHFLTERGSCEKNRSWYERIWAGEVRGGEGKG